MALSSDFSFCFQCKVGSSIALRRPIEAAAFIRRLAARVAARAPRPVQVCGSELYRRVKVRRISDTSPTR
jgi:sRNA-binding carbon storage regulator CsrA